MRLLSCHIENFGKLQHLDIEFKKGLNLTVRENGYGKSTLAAFIRVMLYGLSGERKQEETENDRKHYAPWQGGRFGGELCIEAAGRKYRIERSFGSKRSEDSFSLYDMETNLPSLEYSERIGEELLEIDGESFLKTVFIGQQEAASALTSGIHAKLGNVSALDDDMKRYSEVMEKLKNELNALSPNRRTGGIFRKRMELEQLSVELRQKDGAERRLRGTEEALAEKRESLSALEAETESLEKRIHALSRYQERSSQRLFYEGLQEEERKAALRLENGEKWYFSSEFSEMSRDARGRRRQSELLLLSQLFREGAPEEWELQEKERALSKIEFLKKRWRLSQEERRAEEERRLPRPLLLAGLLLSFTAAASGLAGLLYLLPSGREGITARPAFLPLCLLSLSGLLLSALFARLLGKREKAFESTEEERSIEEEIQGLSGGLHAFLSRYYPEEKEAGSSWDTAEQAMRLRRLSGDALRYRSLRELEELEGEYKASAEKRRRYEEKQEDGALSAPLLPVKESRTLEELSGLLSESMQKRRREEDQRRLLLQELEQEKRELERLGEKENAYEEGLSELSELESRHTLLLMTRDRLSLAKERFTGSCMEPLMEAFGKYYTRMLGNTDGSLPAEGRLPFRMDAELELHLLSGGGSRSTALLSEGYKDLVALCRRFALVDAMYRKEKPFLILDDPFVNLDEDKLRGGLAFLEELSAEYQILYFTCHESRTLS